MDNHDHDYSYAEKYHRHYDLEDLIDGLRADLNQAHERISQLEETLHEHQMAVPHAESGA